MEPLAIDAANGVGAVKLANIRQILAKYIRIEIFNDRQKGHLNEKVNKKIKKFSWEKILFVFVELILVWCLIMLNFIKKLLMVYH